MSLQYGFNSHGWDKDREKWQAKFAAFDAPTKDFYHNVLPWTLMMVDVGHVSKDTIPVISHRIFKTRVGEEFVPNSTYLPVGVDSTSRRMSPTEYQEFLAQFIGFEANVNTLTDRDWSKKFLPDQYNSKASIKSDAQADAERKRFNAEVLGVPGGVLK